MLIWNQFGIIQNFQTSPIPQTSVFVGTFFAVSYSKTALSKAISFQFTSHDLYSYKKQSFEMKTYFECVTATGFPLKCG